MSRNTRSTAPGGVYVAVKSSPHGIILAYGTTVPADATQGFAPGCFFMDVNASAGSQLYCNEGTKASSDFNACMPLGAPATLNATLAEIDRSSDVSTRLIAGSGTLTLTELLHDGKIVRFDTASGTVLTLPAATGSGATFKCLVTVTATSNSHIIKVANSSDTMVGFVYNNDLDGTTVAFYKAGSTDDTITMNRTTTGGVIGDWIECQDMLANLWHIRGNITCVAGSNVATPFSATV